MLWAQRFQAIGSGLRRKRKHCQGLCYMMPGWRSAELLRLSHDVELTLRNFARFSSRRNFSSTGFRSVLAATAKVASQFTRLDVV